MKDIQVLSLNNNVLIPKIDRSSKAIDGFANLVQRIVKCLLARQGSDIFNPEFGVGLGDVLPKLYDESKLESVKTMVNQSILTVERLIKEDDKIEGLRPEEQLATLNLRNLSFDVNQTAWVVDLNLVTVSGASFNFGVKA